MEITGRHGIVAVLKGTPRRGSLEGAQGCLTAGYRGIGTRRGSLENRAWRVSETAGPPAIGVSGHGAALGTGALEVERGSWAVR